MGAGLPAWPLSSVLLSCRLPATPWPLVDWSCSWRPGMDLPPLPAPLPFSSPCPGLADAIVPLPQDRPLPAGRLPQTAPGCPAAQHQAESELPPGTLASGQPCPSLPLSPAGPLGQSTRGPSHCWLVSWELQALRPSACPSQPTVLHRWETGPTREEPALLTWPGVPASELKSGGVTPRPGALSRLRKFCSKAHGRCPGPGAAGGAHGEAEYSEGQPF